MIRIAPNRIVAGRRFTYDIFDSSGMLVLPRGNVMNAITEAKLAGGGFRHARSSKSSSVFMRMAAITRRVHVLENDLVARNNLTTWAYRVETLVAALLELVDEDPDASFANVHLEVVHPYSVVHQLMAAIVTARLALTLKLDASQRSSLVAAALTHDLGVIAMRQHLDTTDELNEEQRLRLRRHPEIGVALLRELGVTDATWLDAVRDHHEYLDGSGYLGKHCEELPQSARILALADTYSAMLRPRPYRDRFIARTALEQLYTSESHRYDARLLEILIWDLGFYPPGSLLRLANNEIAVAIRCTPGLLDSPRVAALSDSHGRPLARPFQRNTQDARFSIIGTLDPMLANRSARLLGDCWILDKQPDSNPVIPHF